VNNSYQPSKAQLGEPAGKKFSLRGALVSYLAAVTTLVTLIIALGLVVSGQFPTARGYWVLWSFALVSSVVVALIGGYRIKNSFLGATGVGVIGGLSLLAITSAAAFSYGVFLRAA